MLGPPSSPIAGWVASPYATVLLALVVLAGMGTAALFVLGLVAYRRRRSRSYGYVAAALGLLVARSIVGLGTLRGTVPMAVHHGVEHGIDLLVALLVLAAIYAQRLDRPRSG